MIKKYHKLFQIELFHAYFREGKSKDLSLEPTPLTGRLMQKLGMRWVTKAATFEAYWSSEVKGAQVLAPAKLSDQPLILNFVLRTSNPSFYNYTNLSLAEDKRAQCYYFNNQKNLSGGELSTSDPEQTEQAKKVVGDTDLRYFGNSLQFFKCKSKNQVATLKDLAGNVISSGPIPANQLKTKEAQPEQSLPERYEYALNLAEEDWGYYELLLTNANDAEDTQEYQICYLPDQIQQQAVGMLQIIIDPTTLSLEEDEQSPDHYQLSFANRYTKWRYMLMNTNNLSYDDVKILLGEQELAILKSSKEERKNEPDKHTISLQEARPLQEIHAQNLKLDLLQSEESEKDAKEPKDPKTVYNIPLPSPDIQRIYPARVDGVLAYYSDMFIYL